MRLIIMSLLLSTVAQAQPKTDIIGFRSGPGRDKSTLVVECANGRRIELILSNKFLKEKNVDTIFDKLIAECEK